MILPDATISDVEARRSAHQDVSGLDVKDLTSELWLVNQELARRRFYRIPDRAVNLANGDYVPSREWLLRRRRRLEAELGRRRRQ